MRDLTRIAFYSVIALSSPLLAQSNREHVSEENLEATGQWRLNNSGQSCDLQHDFGNGDRSVTLQISRVAGPAIFDIALAGSGIAKLRKSSGINVHLSTQGVTRLLIFDSANPRRAYDVDAGLFSDLSDSQQLSFSRENAVTLTLDLPRAKAAFASMQTCYENLLRGWGVDPTSLAKLPRAPYQPGVLPEGGNPGVVIAQLADRPPPPIPKNSWVSWSDYPSAALRAERSGTVVMVLSVSATGRVETCRVAVSSQFRPLDEESCQLMIARAHYPPVAGTTGDAKGSTAIERIRWVIPRSF
ncbi:energy transducer TonB [Novosphingobium sp. G106]|nr:energy transducer TonB [Novosphingobium sp. G106]